MSSNGEKVASGEAFPGIDRGEDFFGGLFSKTFEAGYGAIFASALESTEGADGKLVVESFDFFWPEPLEFKEFEELLYAWHFIVIVVAISHRRSENRISARSFPKGSKES